MQCILLFCTALRPYTRKQLKEEKSRTERVPFVFYRLCAPLNGMAVISHENVCWGIGKWTRSWKWLEKRVAMSVGAQRWGERECVCRLHKFVQLAITASRGEDKEERAAARRRKNVLERKSVPFKRHFLANMNDRGRFLALEWFISSQTDERKLVLLLRTAVAFDAYTMYGWMTKISQPHFGFCEA